MDRFVERCAGLDVHKDSVAATVRVPACERGSHLKPADRGYFSTGLDTPRAPRTRYHLAVEGCWRHTGAAAAPYELRELPAPRPCTFFAQFLHPFCTPRAAFG
jgi:hypothetical protein